MESDSANIERQRNSNNDDLSSGNVPRHITGQIYLNKLILTKIASTLNQDPAADLTLLLSDVSTSYASKRSKTTEPRKSTRKDRATERPDTCEKFNVIPLPSNLKLIIYPLAPAALAALGLSGACSAAEIEPALDHLPQMLERGKILYNYSGRQVVALDTTVVVKCGPGLDPAEHYLLDYLRVHCPATRSPEPLGYVLIDQKPHLFMTRIPGVTLHSRWPTMSISQKESVCSTLNTMLSELHNIPWTPGIPLGTLIPPYTCKDTRQYVRTGGPIYNEFEFNDFLLCTPHIRISSSYLKWLRSCLRDDHRIVLSHGDLNPKNIILQDDQSGGVVVSGIIDWEMGGWYPEYWDALKALNVKGTDDESDWWCCLPERLNQYNSEKPTMTIQHGRTYVLVNGKSGTVLDLSGTDGHSIHKPPSGVVYPNNLVLQWVVENNNNQWTFKNVGTGRYLGIASGNLKDNTQLRAVDQPVAWDIWPDDTNSSVHRIFAPGTKLNVDLSDHGNAKNGTPVTLWGKWKGTNQTWKFEEA
ncbi:hypothetical protein D9615_008632 [Tricholomella constricta]|uniref:Aminoglycoside phosphotransferase domain-containing protein n=1 Tax=Tricholomella constricta TaxID=117010 RepID=A0A8H5H493_9AGAR|nr:hypothetical protein D9615_008632 [Tricholomella constricta]